jgi:integrase
MLPKPWYRASKKAWYLQVGRGQQLCLGKTKDDADRRYRQWLLEEGGQMPADSRRKLTIGEIGQEFLDHSKRHNDPKTYQFYCFFVVLFVERFGSASATEFIPRTFNKWLDEQTGWKGSRRCAIIAIKRMFNWAVDEKLLAVNPLKSVKKPPVGRRNRILSPKEREAVMAAIRDEQFREFFQALLDTGCRPSEVMNVTAAHVSADVTMWVLDEHKTDRTGLKRVVYLSPQMQQLTRKLVDAYPEGPLFRSFRRSNGVRRPWTINGIRCRFKRLRERFAQRRKDAPPDKRRDIPDLTGVTSYVLRHTFTTQALGNGLSTALVASLLGHKSTKMLDEHYSHLDQTADVLKSAAARAVQPPLSSGVSR